MRNKDGKWLCMAAIAATTLALAGCNEPSGSPRSDTSNASAVSPYTPGKKVIPLTSCNLEQVDGVTFAADPVERSTAQTHSFSGWIATPQLDKPAYHLRFDDKNANRFSQASVRPSIARPDVTAIAGNETFSAASGFKLDLAGGTLTAGEYHVYLVAVTGGVVYSCDNGRKVIFRI